MNAPVDRHKPDFRHLFTSAAKVADAKKTDAPKPAGPAKAGRATGNGGWAPNAPLEPKSPRPKLTAPSGATIAARTLHDGSDSLPKAARRDEQQQLAARIARERSVEGQLGQHQLHDPKTAALRSEFLQKADQLRAAEDRLSAALDHGTTTEIAQARTAVDQSYAGYYSLWVRADTAVNTEFAGSPDHGGRTDAGQATEQQQLIARVARERSADAKLALWKQDDPATEALRTKVLEKADQLHAAEARLNAALDHGTLDEIAQARAEVDKLHASYHSLWGVMRAASSNAASATERQQLAERAAQHRGTEARLAQDFAQHRGHDPRTVALYSQFRQTAARLHAAEDRLIGALRNGSQDAIARARTDVDRLSTASHSLWVRASTAVNAESARASLDHGAPQSEVDVERRELQASIAQERAADARLALREMHDPKAEALRIQVLLKADQLHAAEARLGAALDHGTSNEIEQARTEVGQLRAACANLWDEMKSAFAKAQSAAGSANHGGPTQASAPQTDPNVTKALAEFERLAAVQQIKERQADAAEAALRKAQVEGGDVQGCMRALSVAQNELKQAIMDANKAFEIVAKANGSAPGRGPVPIS